jgi:hypothetical protein
MTTHDLKKHRQKQAAVKAADTKGQEERSRAARMASYTRKHGKNDAANPYSRENYYKDAKPGTPTD